MKVCHTVICFFFLTLQDGNTGLINADILIKEGGNITHACSFTFSGSRKIFCRNECEEQDILVETAGDRAQSGRYSIEYREGTYPVSSTLLYVSITNLTKSDSGRYRCSLDRDWAPDSYEEFVIRVEDDSTTSKPNWTPRPLSTSVPSASTLTTTKSLSTSSKSSTPSSASPEATKQTHQEHRTPAAGPGVLLYVGLILVVMIIILSVAALIFCRKKTSKPKEPPVEMEYANVAEPDRVYEEIRNEDTQSRSPPVEISTVYTYTKPNGVETTNDNYSFVATASSQKITEDDSSYLPYSQVDFSNSTAASVNSAPRGDADKVVYSVPRVEASLDGSHAEDTSLLYSTAT
ncbi:uncharacterized protein LOC119905075 isoform X4 [Micropterus salmoides]|uniref:uncharacterized protein LOC119905075 isoform X4 n=1 Tax=Micropterus salmoides TaxID=27706 RepID=UPI0018EE20C1|nr:uncharacterized protein LOC119905075 isoform X4 [Micropterus salmoides]